MSLKKSSPKLKKPLNKAFLTGYRSGFEKLKPKTAQEI